MKVLIFFHVVGFCHVRHRSFDKFMLKNGCCWCGFLFICLFLFVHRSMCHVLGLTSSHTIQCGNLIIFSSCLLIEPNAPPSNVTGNFASSTSIFVSWGQVPLLDRNGVILSHTITYRALPSGSTLTKVVTAPASQTTLTGLNEYTYYNITVFASTLKGRGRESTPIVVITDEDSKFLFVIHHLCTPRKEGLPAASHRNPFVVQYTCPTIFC